MTDYESIYKETYDYQYISFDLFDTLIKRSVSSPELIFDLVEIDYNKEYSPKISDFRAHRMRAEQYARKMKTKEDITIHDIYYQLPYDADRCNILKEEEKYIELSTCFANEPMVEICQKCIRDGKKIIITTDMYLERDTISKILEKIGIKDYFFLFISSEIGYTKQSGNIYDHILSTLNIVSSELIHIGDNKKSDYDNAIYKGIKAIWLEEVNCASNYWGGVKTDDIVVDHLCSVINNKNILKETVEYKLGYRLIGPVLYNFCTWLHQEVICKKIEKIEFVAREGYLISLVYKALFPDEENKIKYLRINKNTLRLPMLYLDNSLEMFLSLIPIKKEYYIQDIFQFLYVDQNSGPIMDLMEKYDYTHDSVVKKADMKTDSRFNAFYRECTEICASVMRRQYIYLQRYIIENDLTGKIAFVNNSVNANAQRYLNIINEKSSLNIEPWGIHFIISKEGKNVINNECSVWFHSKCRKFEKRVFCHYCLIFEHLLFEEEGSALYYVENGNKIETICENHEYEVENDCRIRDIREGCLKFQRDYKEMMPLYVKPTINLRALSNFLLKPEREDAGVVGGLVDYEYGRYLLVDKWGNAKRILANKTVEIYNAKLHIRLTQKII